MLAEDCEQFLHFLQLRDPVFVVKCFSESSEIETINNPWKQRDLYCLWNQAVLPSLSSYETGAKYGMRYAINRDLPVVELDYPGLPVQWNDRSALLQGRLWASFQEPTKEFSTWYKAIVRWIRKNFRSNPVPLGGFVGEAAYGFYQNGGLLLPAFLPPVTSQWLSWVQAQDQCRTAFKPAD
jgi:hypothetical protein